MFENFIINELLKQFLNRGRQAPLHFWRDKVGHEIDIIIETADDQLIPIEIKSSKTINKEFFKNINYWQQLNGQQKAFLVYAGTEDMSRKETAVLGWPNAHLDHILPG